MSLPICPLMSAGSSIEVICAQEKCAWYIKNYKTCSVFVLGHSAVLDIKQKQAQAQSKDKKE